VVKNKPGGKGQVGGGSGGGGRWALRGGGHDMKNRKKGLPKKTNLKRFKTRAGFLQGGKVWEPQTPGTTSRTKKLAGQQSKKTSHVYQTKIGTTKEGSE